MNDWKTCVELVIACVIGALVGREMWELSGEWWLSATMGITVAWVWGHARIWGKE